MSFTFLKSSISAMITERGLHVEQRLSISSSSFFMKSRLFDSPVRGSQFMSLSISALAAWSSLFFFASSLVREASSSVVFDIFSMMSPAERPIFSPKNNQREASVFITKPLTRCILDLESVIPNLTRPGRSFVINLIPLSNIYFPKFSPTNSFLPPIKAESDGL